MADKAIYSVDTVTSMLGTDKVYVNTGNNIKQITMDNLWGNYVDGIKNDLSDYGLNNIFDGVWTQQGEYVVSNFFPVKTGDKIKLIYSDSSKLITLSYYDSSQNWLGNIEYEIGSIFTIPNNSSYIMISIKAVTVDTAGHIGVYVNNQIDVVKNDVDNIKNRLSLKYTYLKTGGGNTITIKVDGDGIVNHRKAIEVIITSQTYYNVEKILIYLNGDLSGFNWASLGGTSKLVSSIELSDGNLVFMFSDNNYWGDMTFIDHSGIFTFTNA